MDLRQINYFIAVAEERSLARAAERLHLSQPPLTRQIQALESDLGVKLFERMPRGMVLTQAGETLMQDARNILRLVGQAASRAQRAGKGELGQLDVGLYGSATFGLVPQVLSLFRARFPDVEMALHYAQTPQQVPALRQGRVLIVFERLLPQEDDLVVELVARERLMVALASDHPLASSRSLPIQALEGQTIRMGTAPSATVTVATLCQQAGFEPRFGPQASDVVMATLHVSISSDVTLVPASMINVQIPGVSYVPLDPGVKGATMDLYCFHRKEETSPLLASMLAVVRAFRKGKQLAR